MRNTLLGITALALTVTAHTARADAPGATMVTAPLATEADSAGPKSQDLAAALALGGSVAGPAIMVTAAANGNAGSLLHDEAVPLFLAGALVAVVGPSAGTLYAGRPFTTGLGLRVAGGLGVALGGAMFVGGALDGGGGAVVGLGLGAAGLGAVAVGTLMDIREASIAAGDYNRAHRARRDWTLAPTVTRQPGGAAHTGLAVVGRF